MVEAGNESHPQNTRCQPTVAIADNPFSQWDFVPADQLPDQDCLLGPGCDGSYVEPLRDWPDANLDPKHAPLRSSSGNTELIPGFVTLSDKVILTKGNSSLQADNAKLDRNTNMLTLDGSVTLRQPGTLIRSDHAIIDTDTQLGVFDNAIFLDYNNGDRLTAELADRIGEQQLEFEGAQYTRCTPSAELWSLKAAHLSLDYETGQGTAKHARLKLWDTPIFYFPWLRFPLDDRRMSGFLWPSLGHSSNSGFEIAAPYYLNIAPNFDMTITPRHLADRGNMAEVEARYLNRYGWLTLSGGYLADDDETGEDRWIEDAKHQGRYGHGWSSYLNYTKVSDDDYFKDLTVSSLDIKRQTHLDQNIGMAYNSLGWSAELEAAKYQTIDNLVLEPYKRLPQLTLQNNASGTNFSPDLIFLTQLTSFDHNDDLDSGGLYVTGERYFVEGGLSFPMNWSAGYIIPTGKVRHLSYELDTGSSSLEESPDTTVGLGTVDMGLFFDRDILWGKNDYTQTLEPRLYYFYSEHEQQLNNPNFDTNKLTFTYSQLFRDTRFAGYDRLDDANQLSASVTTRFLRNGDGRETLSMSIGRIFYFDDRHVQVSPIITDPGDNTSSSEIAGQLTFQPLDNLWVTSSTLWETKRDHMTEASVAFHYISASSTVYNLSYRFDRDNIFAPEEADLFRDLEQADVSIALPVNQNWSLYGRYLYDIDASYSLEKMIGVQYESCCWLTRIAYQQAVLNEDLSPGNLSQERDNIYLIEFQLKGLGSIGQKAADLFRESIFGYEETR